MGSEASMPNGEVHSLTNSPSGSPVASSPRELGFGPSPLMSSPNGLEPMILDTPGQGDVSGDTALPIPNVLTLFSGPGFEECPQPGHYAPSIKSNCSLPSMPYHQPPAPDEKCYSDNGDNEGDDRRQRSVSQSGMAHSLSPITTVQLWQRALDDWKTDRPARSVGHAKRRRKNKVRHSINRIEALFPRGPTLKGAEKNENQEK
ncbi:hypothetical protein GE09DRAFT_1137135 [Coniochaeta sp. 2T2.1]|nr:hypothetical protein GE09DRAFT_1137135 [Coniochaeta sp. 2T2.1]